MTKEYQVIIEVTVDDLAALRAYALQRAEQDCQIDEDEFETGESDDEARNIRYWLAWAFDAGTPRDCGFTIQDSHVHDLDWPADDEGVSNEVANYCRSQLTGD